MYPTFEFTMHFPYYELRETATPDAEPKESVDLSFLSLESERSQDSKKYSVYSARFSLVICGSDQRRWTAFAFFDGNAPANTEIDDDEGSKESDNGEVDRIASPSEADQTLVPLDSNLSICEPREYFLLAVSNQSAAVLNLECSIQDHVCPRFLFLLNL